jgi:hypothetical protein
MNLEFWVGILHIIFSFSVASYGIITESNEYDFFYIIIILLILIGWTFSGGECIINNIFNRIEDINENNILETRDISLVFSRLFDNPSMVYKNYRIIIANLLLLSLFFIANRNSFSIWIPTLFSFIILIYIYFLQRNINDIVFLTIQDIIKFLGITALIYITMYRDNIKPLNPEVSESALSTGNPVNL